MTYNLDAAARAAEGGNVMGFLQNCPNCGSTLVHLRRNQRGKYKYECMGDCWTQTKWFWSESEAAYAWNRLTKEPKEET